MSSLTSGFAPYVDASRCASRKRLSPDVLRGKDERDRVVGEQHAELAGAANFGEIARRSGRDAPPEPPGNGAYGCAADDVRLLTICRIDSWLTGLAVDRGIISSFSSIENPLR